MSERALQVVALVGYGGFLALAFGQRTFALKRTTGDSGWRRPVSPTDAVGETLCALGCIIVLLAPVAGLTTLTAPAVGAGHAGGRFALGAVLLIAGTGLALWAQRHLAAQWRAGIEASTVLITSGPFARVRNPFYVGCMVAATAVMVLVPSAVALGGLALHVVASDIIVRWVEEPVLASAHGGAFERYERRTGRFVPRPTRT